MTFKEHCKKSWGLLLCILGFVIEPFVFWWFKQYFLSVSTALICWICAVSLIIVFFVNWHDIKKVYNQCQKDIKESKSVNNNKY